MDIRRLHTYASCSFDDRQITARLENPQTCRCPEPTSHTPWRCVPDRSVEAWPDRRVYLYMYNVSVQKMACAWSSRVGKSPKSVSDIFVYWSYAVCSSRRNQAFLTPDQLALSVNFHVNGVKKASIRRHLTYVHWAGGCSKERGGRWTRTSTKGTGQSLYPPPLSPKCHVDAAWDVVTDDRSRLGYLLNNYIVLRTYQSSWRLESL